MKQYCDRCGEELIDEPEDQPEPQTKEDMIDYISGNRSFDNPDLCDYCAHMMSKDD